MSKLAELLAHRAATPATPATDDYLERAWDADSSKSSSRSRHVPAFAGPESVDAEYAHEAREERAAILEYDAGFSRAEAERQAGVRSEFHIAPQVGSNS